MKTRGAKALCLLSKLITGVFWELFKWNQRHLPILFESQASRHFDWQSTKNVFLQRNIYRSWMFLRKKTRSSFSSNATRLLDNTTLFWVVPLSKTPPSSVIAATLSGITASTCTMSLSARRPLEDTLTSSPSSSSMAERERERTWLNAGTTEGEFRAGTGCSVAFPLCHFLIQKRGVRTGMSRGERFGISSAKTLEQNKKMLGISGKMC